ncbi:MAG: hypothetical protein ACLR8P_23375 [Clostridium fessum]
MYSSCLCHAGGCGRRWLISTITADMINIAVEGRHMDRQIPSAVDAYAKAA